MEGENRNKFIFVIFFFLMEMGVFLVDYYELIVILYLVFVLSEKFIFRVFII